MTDLQASLMAIGGTILAGVVTYNKWQEYKAKKSLERAFSSTHDDVLMKPDIDIALDSAWRREPAFDQEAETEDQSNEGAESNADTIKDTVAHTAPPVAKPKESSINKEFKEFQVFKELPVDELIDCIIPLVPETPVRGDKVISVTHGLRHVGNKPVHFIGECEDGHRESIQHGKIYTTLYAGAQLANRHGVLNELEYSELVTRLRQVADELNAEPDVPDMRQIISIARELFRFVNEHAVQLSVNVASKSAPWAINALLAALERQGFDLRPDGRLVMPDGDGGILFSLSTNVTLAAETTPCLTLLLDVPCVAPSHDGFGAMVACAKVLAGRLGGIVVDDSRQPLTDAALSEIAEQVTAFYVHMEEANVPAGSARALRLFS